jgi:hypothetical protein
LWEDGGGDLLAAVFLYQSDRVILELRDWRHEIRMI